MENFIYKDNFCTDLGHLMDHLELDEEDLKDLEDNWNVEIEHYPRTNI